MNVLYMHVMILLHESMFHGVCGREDEKRVVVFVHRFLAAHSLHDVYHHVVCWLFMTCPVSVVFYLLSLASTVCGFFLVNVVAVLRSYIYPCLQPLFILHACVFPAKFCVACIFKEFLFTQIHECSYFQQLPAPDGRPRLSSAPRCE